MSPATSAGGLLEGDSMSVCLAPPAGQARQGLGKAQLKAFTDSAIDRLACALAAGRSEALRSFLAAMAKFHRYSIGNLLLIRWQRPDASRVAGFRTWQKLGRHVRKGERAIRILAPIVLRSRDTEDTEDEEVAAFRTACVFDISQTEGRELAEFAKVRGDPGEHLERLKQFLADRGVRLEYSDRIGSAQGACGGGRIILRTGLTPGEEFSTLAHETAHWLLHQCQEATEVPRTVAETEAEAVAFVVCQAACLDTGTAASDYIQLYDGKKETLLASLGRIHSTSSRIIRAILPAEGSAT